MFKVVCLTIVVGLTAAASRTTTRADDAANETQCVEEIEEELRGYVRSDVWQRLFARHYKFVVDGNGKVSSSRKRLKFNTILHNALYGCDHGRDDEVDDCPNICRGCIKSCERGRNLRAAMFRTARCAFVESTVKHLVLSDVLLDAFPSKEVTDGGVADLADRPIREFGEPVADMLSVLAHGETGGLAELMAVNLYLNNRYGTVFMARVPPAPVARARDFAVAAERMRAVHAVVLDRLRAFWTTWCADRDVVAQYRAKYRRGVEFGDFRDVTREMEDNLDDANALIRGLNVADRAVIDWDFDPERVALRRLADRLVAGRSMPPPLLAEVGLAAFRCSYEFDPRALYDRLGRSVFRAIHACFCWTAIAHLRLALRYAEDAETVGEDQQPHRRHAAAFAAEFVRFRGPLTAFRDHGLLHRLRRAVPRPSSPEAVEDNVARLVSFFRRLRDDDETAAAAADRATHILTFRPEMRELVESLTADMVAVSGVPPPHDYFGRLSYETALELMRTNYRAFARLVAAASGCQEDLANFMKLKRFFFFLSETVEFGGGLR